MAARRGLGLCRLAWRTGLLTVPLLASFYFVAPSIADDFAQIPATVANRAANWQAGRAAEDQLKWVNAAVPRIANGWLLEPGTYRRFSETEPGPLDWRCFSILIYFGKHTMQVPYTNGHKE